MLWNFIYRRAPRQLLFPFMLAVSSLALTASADVVPPQSTQAASTSAPTTAAASEKLDQARRRYDQSFYDLAIQSFDAAAQSFPLESAIGRARCLLRLQRPLEALDALSAIDSAAGNVESRLARAEALESVGRFEEALADYRTAIELSSASIPTRSHLGRLLDYLGRSAEAAVILKPLESLDPKKYPDDPAIRVELALARLSLLQLAPPEDVADASSHILNTILLPIAEGTHRARWQARLAIADLLAAKHNTFEARKDYEAVLQLNPRIADPHVGLALLDFERNDYDNAQEHITAALAIAPRSPAVLRAAAAVRLVNEDAPAALALLNQALEINPNDIESLALSASIHFAIHRPADAEKIIARATAINPRSHLLHGVVGSWLAARRQFAAAERHLQLAVDYAPHNPEVRCELAHVWLLLGREKEAGEALRAARKSDPFNERVVNYLNLLIDLESMARIDTDNFIIRYDQTRDALIGRPAADWMEKCHVEVTGIFNFIPTQKTLVEIFPTRDEFGIRISGRPWVGTVGACTGPVIACCSPRKEGWSAYGWADCLRHEYVHTVTLGVTDNQITRWLTEGLAVHYQSGSKPVLGWKWSLLIANKFRTGEIFPLRSIEAGFQRPRTYDSVQQAYAQASLMVRFMLERFGPDVFLRILPEYKTLRDERLVFERILQVPYDQFDREFDSWLEKQLVQWGFPTTRIPSESELRQRIEKNKRDADALGFLARRTYLNHDIPSDDRSKKRPAGGSDNAKPERKDLVAEARRLANRALEINEKQPDALLVYALTPESPTEREAEDVRAQRLNEFYHEVRPLIELAPDEPEALLVVAQLALATDRPEAAADLCLRLTAKVAQCTVAHQILADLYEKAGDVESAYPHLQQWALQNGDDAAPSVRIAELLLKQLESAGDSEAIVAGFPSDADSAPSTQPSTAPSRAAAAIEWSQRVLRIDPFTLDHHKRLGRAFIAARRWTDAIGPLRIVTDADAKDEAAWTALAEALFRAGKKAESAAAAEKAIALNADSHAQRILDALNDAP